MIANNQLVEQYELVKRIDYIFDGCPKIKGAIYRIIRGPESKFMWDINYYCKIENEFDFYIPSAPFGTSIEETENKLFKYVKRFEKAVAWNINESF